MKRLSQLLVITLVLLTPLALHAQTPGDAPHLKPKAAQSASAQNAGPGDAFVLTSDVGDTLMVVGPGGEVLVGQAHRGWMDSGESFVSVTDDASSFPSAGIFLTRNPANQGVNLYSETRGTGPAGAFFQRNDTSRSAAVLGYAYNRGNAGDFQIRNGQSDYSAVYTRTEGLGRGGDFIIDNAANDLPAVSGVTNGTGQAAYFERSGSGSDFGPVVQARQEGTAGFAPAILAEQAHAENGAPAILAVTQGNGPALVAATEGDGDIAHFNAGNEVRMRIDNGGNVYADGGFQGGGADVAEAFDVEGAAASYAPGDVLAISTRSDRTVERSQQAYSTLVAGVYATKPGVLLSEQGLATDMSERVPMGVVGVLPTNVTLEGGPIRRGDLLVTSSTPGAAMKADPERVGVGQVLGKALQDFGGAQQTGTIKVLVSVK